MENHSESHNRTQEDNFWTTVYECMVFVKVLFNTGNYFVLCLNFKDDLTNYPHTSPVHL